MNQKNIFTVIGAILVLQGIVFYLMGDKMSSSVFPATYPTLKLGNTLILSGYLRKKMHVIGAPVQKQRGGISEKGHRYNRIKS